MAMRWYFNAYSLSPVIPEDLQPPRAAMDYMTDKSRVKDYVTLCRAMYNLARKVTRQLIGQEPMEFNSILNDPGQAGSMDWRKAYPDAVLQSESLSNTQGDE